jgi:multidrug efflux pump subunit AcrA (membrane-fusion protein)
MSEQTNNAPAAPASGPVTDQRAGNLSDRVRSLRLPDRSEKPRGTWLPWLLCALLGLAAVFFAWRSGQGKSPDSSGDRPSGPNAQGATQAKGDGKESIILESKGYIVPIQLVQVSPKVGGTVMKLFIKEGDRVEKGAELAHIEEVEYRREFEKADAAYRAVMQRLNELTEYRGKEISQAKAEWDDAVAQREQLYADWRRSEGLRSTQALAQRELEQARSAYDSAKYRAEKLRLTHELIQKGPRDARIAAVTAEVAQAKAEMLRAKWKLDNCTVTAPIKGIILSKKAEENNQVNPAAFSNGLSASLCEMADLTKMEVELAIAERDVRKVYAEQKCQVRAEAFLDRIYEGYVSRVMPSADRSKGAVPVRVKILIPAAEEGKFLRPEMGAVVTFFDEKSPHARRPDGPVPAVKVLENQK